MVSALAGKSPIDLLLKSKTRALQGAMSILIGPKYVGQYHRIQHKTTN